MESTVQVGRLVIHAAGSALARLQIPEDETTVIDDVPPSHYQRFQDAVFLGLIPWLQKILYLAFIATVLLLTSIGTYGAFYFMVMPSTHASEHLYFDYTCGGSITTTTPRGKEEDNNMVCCIPVASVDLFSKHAPWEAFHPMVSPSLRSEDRILVAHQPYFMELLLHLPESTTNRNAGIFGVRVQLQARNGTALASSIRSARLPHESDWVGVVRKMILIIPLLVGATTEHRTIVIPSYRHFVESHDLPLRYVVVKLLSRGNQWPSGSPIEVVHGEVRIGKELSTFQNVLKEWFYTCAIVGVTFLFGLQVTMWAVVQQIWVNYWRQRQLQVMDDDDDNNNPHNNVFDNTFSGGGYEYFHDDNNHHDHDDDNEWDPMPSASEEMNYNEANRTPNLTNEHDSENEIAPMTTTTTMNNNDDPAHGNFDESKEEEDSRTETRVQGENELLDIFTDHDPLDFQSLQSL